ncbi:MAG: hypothetical protein MZV63_23735 [Marinilabiliales bacterium]|nr:hypothetical protein [Marinilabiliales bacterium]
MGLAPRQAAERRHPGPAEFPVEAHRDPASPDAGTRRGGAGRRGGVGRALAGQLRREHGRLRHSRGRHGLPAGLPRGRVLLFRRRARRPGRRRSGGVRPGDHGGRDVPVRRHQGQDDPVAAHRGCHAHHGCRQRAPAHRRVPDRARRTHRVAGGRLRLRQARGLPGGLAGRHRPRRQHRRPELHGGCQVPEVPVAA